MFKHSADNHELQPEKRRRAEVSSLNQQPLAKTANKHGTTNTPTKTNSTAATGPTQPPPSTTTTPSISPSATQAPKSTSTLGKATTEPLTENVVDPESKTGDSSSLKPPQASSNPSSTHGKTSLPNGNNEPISDSLSSADHIPSTDDKQVMLPPKRTEKDAAESATGDHLDDILWTGVDAVENTHKRKGSDGDLPKKKSAKLTAMVSLNCGSSDEDTKVLVTIAKNGLDARFEVIQEGSEF